MEKYLTPITWGFIFNFFWIWSKVLGQESLHNNYVDTEGEVSAERVPAGETQNIHSGRQLQLIARITTPGVRYGLNLAELKAIKI